MNDEERLGYAAIAAGAATSFVYYAAREMMMSWSYAISAILVLALFFGFVYLFYTLLQKKNKR